MNKVYISQEQAELIHGEEEALAHVGVKGMKWGVRKEREASGGSAFSRKDRVVGSKKEFKRVLTMVKAKYGDIERKAEPDIQKSIKNINKNWPREKFKNASASDMKAYNDSISKAITDAYTKHTASMMKGQMPRNIEWGWSYDAGQGGWPQFWAAQKKQP